MIKKNCLFVLLSSLLITSCAFAQEVFHIGLTGGLDATDVKGMDMRDNDNDFNKLGFTVGGLVSAAISKDNSVQMEINYIQKGSLQKPDSSNQNYYKLSLNYLEVPVLFKHRLHFNIYRRPTNNFQLEGGASIGKLVGPTNPYVVSVTTAGNVINYSTYLPLSSLRPIDISLIVGVDFDITSNFIFCIRYTNSILPPIRRDAQISNINFLPYTFNAGNNMVFQFTLKYIFGNVNKS